MHVLHLILFMKACRTDHLFPPSGSDSNYTNSVAAPCRSGAPVQTSNHPYFPVTLMFVCSFRHSLVVLCVTCRPSS